MKVHGWHRGTRLLLAWLLVVGVAVLVGPRPCMAQADLRIQTFLVGTPMAGTVVHYEYQVQNLGPAPALDVTLRDILPAQVEFLDAGVDFENGLGLVPLACIVTGGANSLYCPLGTVPVTGTVPIIVLVDVLIKPGATGSITNNADVNLHDTTDPDTTNNTATATVDLLYRADLGIVKTAVSSSLTPEGTGAVLAAGGGTLTYRIDVANEGPSAAYNVVVTDPLSVDLAYLSSASAACSLVAGDVTCNLGTMQPGDARSLDVTVTVATSPAAASVSNTACAAWVLGDSTAHRACDGEIVPVASADLAVAKTATGEVQVVGQAGRVFDIANPGSFPATNYAANPGQVTAGRRIRYLLTLTNNGPAAAGNVLVTDRLPAGVTLVPGSFLIDAVPSPGACETGTPGDPLDRMRCGLGALAALASRTIQYDVLVGTGVPAGAVLEDDVEVSSDAVDPVNRNNHVSAQTVVNTWADLSIGVSSVGEVIVGYDPVLGRYVYRDLASAVTAGHELRYEITVQNGGASDAANVQVMDVLPDLVAGSQFYAVTYLRAEGAACRPDDEHALWTVLWPSATATGQGIVCDLGTVAAGARKTFDLYVLVDPTVPDATVIDNGALVLFGPSSPPAQPMPLFPGSPVIPVTLPVTNDPFTNDNFAVQNTTVQEPGFTVFGIADLAVGLGTDPAEFSPGQEVAYVVDVTNNGPLAAGDVQVTDLLPEGFTLTAVDFGGGPGGCTIAGELTCFLGAMLDGETRSFRIVGYVKRRMASSAILANGVTVASTSPDLAPENNADLVTTRVRVRNIVGNFGFEDLPIGPPWQELLTDPGDGQDCLVAREGSCSYLLQGVPGVEKRLRQDFVFNGKKGDRIEVAAFSKAQGVSGAGSYRVELRAYLANGWRTFRTQNFDAGTHGWQQRAISFTAPWNFRALSVVVKFKKMAGSAWFDEVRLKVHPGSMP